MPDLFINCHGISFLDEIIVDCGDRRITFVFDDQRKRSRRFALALFINKAALAEDQVKGYPRELRACALFESPINACYRDVDRLVELFPVIFTHQRHLLARGAPFVPLLFGTNWLACHTTEDARRLADHPPDKKGLVSFIGSIQHADTGAYRFRREAAEMALARRDVDCFGKGIREVPSKWEALAPYRFSIAMENASSDHYFSEKLVDCLLLETVPIYHGCPGIGDLLDARGILAFQTMDELRAILDRLSPDLYDALRPHAAANKRTVIERGWYSHPSLFERLAAMLEGRLDPSAQLVPERPTAVRGWMRRLWSSIKTK